MNRLVFLHGWGTHPVIWEPLQDFFPEALAMPLPGYAGSAPAFTLEQMAESIASRLEEGTLLVGWSLGGLVALEIALARPEKLTGLVLIAATPCFVSRADWPHGVATEVFDQFAAGLAGDYAGTIRRFLSLQAQGSGAMREVLAQLRRKLLEQTRPESGVLKAGLGILQSADLRARLPGLGLPVSLIHGSGDRLAPIAASRWMADALPGARLVEIEGAGHAPFLSHPERVAEVIGGAMHG